VLIHEVIPGVAALVDDFVGGFGDPVREPVVALEPPVILLGFSCGHLAGNGINTMFDRAIRAPERLHPA
jgi:hypothetical protein